MIREANKKSFLHILMAAALLTALWVVSCGTSGSTSMRDTDEGGQSKAASNTNAALQDMERQGADTSSAAPGETAIKQNYWTGNGAGGLSIAVLVPEGRDLAKAENYLPAMVQGVIVGDFTKFSAMNVLDRQNLDKVIAEGESGFYENESNFVQLGAVANVQYILNGALQKTGSGFSLQLKVTDAASGASKAAYTGNVTAAELENLTGIKKASGDLLAQLGVSLTEAGKTDLLGASTSNAAAETALAKGVTAQRSGTVVEALSYYYEAAKFDPGLAEAASRSSVLSADITSGNIGQNVRNDIQRRAAWDKTLHEAAAFFKEHPPFEIIYDSALTIGKIDYQKETAEISFKAAIAGAAGLKVIYDLDQGLGKNSRSRDWGVSVDSIYRAIPAEYTFTATLINEDKAVIGTASGRFKPDVEYDFGYADTTVVFSGVDANKISDNLTVSITSVNGINAKTAGERGYMSISTGDLAGLKDFRFELRIESQSAVINGFREREHSESLVIPAKILRWPVTSIEENAFSMSRLTSVVIPNSVTSIGSYAFSDNRLTSAVISNSVTSIGERAFSGNQLSSVVISNSVTSIGDYAFSGNRLASVAIPNSVTSVGSYAFSDNQLTSAVISNSVTSIGDYAFSGNRLTGVVIPNSVTSIGKRAFYNNRLTSVVIPNGVTSIGEFAFYGNQLTGVVIPDSVTSIEWEAFGSNDLDSVTLPANIEIGDDALQGAELVYDTNRRKAGVYAKKELFLTWEWAYMGPK